uniref:Uncharacterized protein n=1 Tax=Anguilla anguilla TaxID=7936 RepID=A0A0E9RM21_ANGAN
MCGRVSQERSEHLLRPQTTLPKSHCFKPCLTRRQKHHSADRKLKQTS